jgi:hypothetical protein
MPEPEEEEARDEGSALALWEALEDLADTDIVEVEVEFNRAKAYRRKGPPEPAWMTFYSHGTTAGKLREAILGVGSAEEFFEQMAVLTNRATMAKGVRNFRVYRHQKWPKTE